MEYIYILVFEFDSRIGMFSSFENALDELEKIKSNEDIYHAEIKKLKMDQIIQDQYAIADYGEIIYTFDKEDF